MGVKKGKTESQAEVNHDGADPPWRGCSVWTLTGLGVEIDRRWRACDLCTDKSSLEGGAKPAPSGKGQDEASRNAGSVRARAPQEPLQKKHLCLCFRIAGDTALNKNIHESVSAQIRKNFAKSKWRVSPVLIRLPVSLTAHLPCSLSSFSF